MIGQDWNYEYLASEYEFGFSISETTIQSDSQISCHDTLMERTFTQHFV